MSKRSVSLLVPRLVTADLYVFINLETCHARTPSVAAKLRLVARFAALAALTVVRGGGAYRDRTDDLMLAKQPLSQLS